MERFVRAFLKASLSWLSLGVTLGVVMAAAPSLIVYRPAHLHMLTLGFVAMMIFGVAYHVIPRFSGHPLHSRMLPVWHWWMSNVGLVLMSAGFVWRHSLGARAAPLLAVGAALSAIGAYVFAFVMWRTLGGDTSVTPARSSEAIALRRVK
jgi:heme/copper-type cytochrome/quinol oxidase subunit 1